MYGELVKELRDSAEWADRLALLMGRAEGDAHAPVMRKAADAIEELSKQHEAQRQNLIALMNDKPRWIPVTERLPEVRTWVLCYCRANSFDVFRMTDEGNWQYGNRSIYMKGYVTHWMPLPPAPKEE